MKTPRLTEVFAAELAEAPAPSPSHFDGLDPKVKASWERHLSKAKNWRGAPVRGDEYDFTTDPSGGVTAILKQEPSSQPEWSYDPSDDSWG